MDWLALTLSLRLAVWTMGILLPFGLWAGRRLAWRRFRGQSLVEALLALPLVLPPTVLGYYLLLAFGGGAALGRLYEALIGRPLMFTFEGLLLASVIVNLPFAIQPMQRAFEAIPIEVREAARCCGLSHWRIFRRIELPLAWPGILSALVLTFAHTLGEFGVVLMVGGNIPGETRTVAIAIYDRVQAFDTRAAGLMAAVLLLVSLGAIAASYGTANGPGRRRG
jgi:molybdate transport system permease protein